MELILRSWEWRWDVAFVLGVSGVLYLRGWWRLRRMGARLPSRGRLASYLSGWVLLWLALISPIDVLGGMLFSIHMVQHLLLMMFAPPLLWLGSPFPIGLWGLPDSWRRRVGRWFRRRAGLRRTLLEWTPRGGVWLLNVVVLLMWHDPNAYNAALRQPWLHDAEHLTFFLASMLYWWQVIQAGPRLHGRFPWGLRLAYLFGMVPITAAAGVAIAFTKHPIYTYYLSVPRFWGIDVMADQRAGGVLMWVGGGMMYMLGALVLIAAYTRKEEGA